MKIYYFSVGIFLVSLMSIDGKSNKIVLDDNFSFQNLPISGDSISMRSLFYGLYHRDSISVIEDFPILLKPEQFYYTPLDSFIINNNSDTLFIRFSQAKRFCQTTSFQVWNKNNGIYAVTAGYGFFGYKKEIDLRDWEQRLIENWNVDSIKALEEPTFYVHSSSNPRKYYVYQIVINNKKVKSRLINYEYLYIPNEYENDPVRNRNISSH